MKTIVFYSYKGGVGRTLAVANFIYALAALDKRVVAMDFDFEAPGLPYKFRLEDEVKEGYVDYLRARGDGEGGDQLTDEKKFKSLKAIALTIPGTHNCYLLPAGDPQNSRYWETLASERFHRLFYFYGDNGQRNQGEFIEDARLIEQTFTPDYLLVDCKNATEIAAVPLMLWADVVVNLVTNNREGFQGSALAQRAIYRHWRADEEHHQKRLVSVLCRLPDGTAFGQEMPRLVEQFRAVWLSLEAKASPGKQVPFPENFRFEVLHEQRGLEAEEKILLEQKVTASANLRLSHDYIALFENIVPELKRELAAMDKNWRNLLGMADGVDLVERYFNLYLHRGSLENIDNQPNVSFRVATFRGLLDTLFTTSIEESTQPPEETERLLERAIHQAGLTTGGNFAAEFLTNPAVWPDGVPADLAARCQRWCDFDSSVGFGRFSCDLAANNHSGQITLAGNILTKDRPPVAPNLNEFFRGYVQGVLAQLAGCSPDKLAVRVSGAEAFAFTLET